MVIQQSVCCHFLTHGCETCQHQKPEHVCSASKRFCKVQMLLSLFYTSIWPSAGTEKCGCSFICDQSQVCTCSPSHTVLSQSVTTHLLLWPVENGSESRMTRRRRVYLDDMSHSDSRVLERLFILAKTVHHIYFGGMIFLCQNMVLKQRSLILICWPYDKVSNMVFQCIVTLHIWLYWPNRNAFSVFPKQNILCLIVSSAKM